MKLYSITTESLLSYQENINKSKEGFDLCDYINQRQPTKIENGIGYVYIQGPLLRKATCIDKQLGCTDYEDIIDDANECIENGAKAILFIVDSGGGSVAGAIEAAEAIMNLPVPTVAYVEGMACSAAYKLIAGTTYIISTKSGSVGNIGAIMVFTDTEKAWNAMGVSFDAFTNEGATLKSTGHLPSLTPEQKGFLQDSINEAGTAFKNHVVTNRPNISEEVFKAGWYSGQRAIDLGLVDELGDEELAEEYAMNLAELFYQPITQPLI